MKNNDLIIVPPYYKKFNFESMDLLEIIFKKTPIKEANFFIGNALKYIIRSKYKGEEFNDLSKSMYYVNKLELYIKGGESKKNLNDEKIFDYLSKIKEVDEYIFCIVRSIVNFSIYPSKRNYVIMQFTLEKYIKMRS